MSSPDAFEVEMRRLLGDRRQLDRVKLDDQTVERLLTGLPGADAPPGYVGCAEALAALGQDPRASEDLLGASEEVPAIVAVVASTHTNPRRRSPGLTKTRPHNVA